MSVFKYHAFIYFMRPPRWRYGTSSVQEDVSLFVVKMFQNCQKVQKAFPVRFLWIKLNSSVRTTPSCPKHHVVACIVPDQFLSIPLCVTLRVCPQTPPLPTSNSLWLSACWPWGEKPLLLSHTSDRSSVAQLSPSPPPIGCGYQWDSLQCWWRLQSPQ
jgi:hypothetical protein